MAIFILRGGSSGNENKKGALAWRERPGKTWGLLGPEDRVLGGLGHAELHDALGRDLDLLAGGGITAEAGFAVDQYQLAQTGQRKAVLRVFVGEFGNVFENL